MRSIAVLVDQSDHGALQALDPAEVDAYVVELLDRRERQYPIIDADGLVSLGVTLHLARQQRVDLAATAWLRQRRSAARLDLVCLLLNGLWRSGRATPAVHADALREIIATHKEIPEAVPSYRFAVEDAVASTKDDTDATAELARQALAELS